ncbi:helix-turn-helix transcriptional regulator [Schumannella sp. 10F1B-5-1]|uniref:ArsR/SmtB family transcription factor n=1 Tax=Schumannella sp. 10F1B-5-1 TaxID=2590780 RepID=UPI0011318306|nr:metalloregulator ArsR/SmtB family transcription factor [Schumannella sp. 10F1B-5-1]TPW71581.1 winged helix-turn-helix transcriptional regulator [Schumannella sp. 10F1B-5-1]
MPADQLSLTFAALADPTRRAILGRLIDGEATVTELAAPHAMSLPAISRHLKVLEHAGLIARGREARWRPCRLETAALADADAWIEPYRRFFGAAVGRLDAQLRAENATAAHPRPEGDTAAVEENHRRLDDEGN